MLLNHTQIFPWVQPSNNICLWCAMVSSLSRWIRIGKVKFVLLLFQQWSEVFVSLCTSMSGTSTFFLLPYQWYRVFGVWVSNKNYNARGFELKHCALLPTILHSGIFLNLHQIFLRTTSIIGMWGSLAKKKTPPTNFLHCFCWHWVVRVSLFWATSQFGAILSRLH